MSTQRSHSSRDGDRRRADRLRPAMHVTIAAASDPRAAVNRPAVFDLCHRRVCQLVFNNQLKQQFAGATKVMRNGI